MRLEQMLGQTFGTKLRKSVTSRRLDSPFCVVFEVGGRKIREPFYEWANAVDFAEAKSGYVMERSDSGRWRKAR